jgi:hypothetical protein
MTRLIKKDMMDKIETDIDKLGISQFLDFVESILYEKADHLRTNWQDDKSAKSYEQLAEKVSKLAYFALDKKL